MCTSGAEGGARSERRKRLNFFLCCGSDDVGRVASVNKGATVKRTRPGGRAPPHPAAIHTNHTSISAAGEAGNAGGAPSAPFAAAPLVLAFHKPRGLTVEQEGAAGRAPTSAAGASSTSTITSTPSPRSTTLRASLRRRLDRETHGPSHRRWRPVGAHIASRLLRKDLRGDRPHPCATTHDVHLRATSMV